MVPVPEAPWLIEQSAGSYAIDPWRLDAPALEYVADGCEFEEIGGLPTLYFWQSGFGGLPLNVIAISMAPGQLKDTIESFSEIRKNLGERQQIWYKDAQVAEGDLKTVPADRHRRFMAGIIRGASTEHSAMLDFYNIEILTAQRVKAIGEVNPNVRDLLRVWMSPPVLTRMLKLLDRPEVSV